MGLEFVLSKGQDEETTRLVAQIFSPSKSLGPKVTGEMGQLLPEKMMALFEAYESGETLFYLDPVKVTQIHHFLQSRSIDEVIACYDPEELNSNGIYPEMWEAGDSFEAMNESTIREGLGELKKIFEAADKEQDSIFVFVG